MPDSQWVYILVCLAGVFLSSVSQVMLKKAAQKSYKNILAEYLNPLVIVAYVVFFATTVISVVAYKGIPLSLGPVLETTGYIYITIFGVVFFKEKLNAKRLAALGLIIAGVLVCAL